MRAAEAGMPALAHEHAVVNEDTADQRVGFNAAFATSGELEGPLHPNSIGCRKHSVTRRVLPAGQGNARKFEPSASEEGALFELVIGPTGPI
jgi:hypothetical protein